MCRLHIEGTNAYRITPDGQRFAVFYTKLHNRRLRPLMAADRPPAPPEIRQPPDTLDRHVTHTINLARLTAA
ncbi:hypothetical protein [Actinospica robiniae]|uniref:hypothetical protein n=1 Tax=Actinospica robiniae TaxID=304901 RepID=UPI0003FCC63A|nr:hypothetical protein [Actinospica robiniae]